jgi:ribonuclease Z
MDNSVYLFWSGLSWTIPGTSWDIIGYSRASYRTGFYIKSLDLMIDAGPQKTGNPKNILITHCHGDHIANIPFTLIGLNKIIDPNTNEITFEKPNIFVPAESKDKLNNYINSMFAANNCEDFNETIVNYYPVKGGEIFNDYISKNTKISIEVFKCDHSVPTVAYGISVKKEHLKEEYRKSESKILGDLRKKGIEITYTELEPKIIFVWDTSINILETSPDVLNYPVIMIECTFLFDDDYEQSLTKKHIHWNSLKPYVIKNNHILFVLTHFSLKYKEKDILAFFNQQNIPNVKPWIHGSSINT